MTLNRSLGGRLSLAMLGAVVGVLAAGPQMGNQGVGAVLPRMPAFSKPLRAILGGGTGRVRGARPPGPGWTIAHVQRMARKRRAVQRHRAAVRTKGRR